MKSQVKSTKATEIDSQSRVGVTRGTPTNPILQLQALYGNRAVTQLLRQGVPVQFGKKKGGGNANGGKGGGKAQVEEAEESAHESEESADENVALGQGMRAIKQVLENIANTVAEKTGDEVEEILEEIPNYVSQAGDAYGDDYGAANTESEYEVLNTLEGEVSTLINQVKMAAEARLATIKQAAWSAWTKDLGDRGLRNSWTKQQGDWTQILKFPRPVPDPDRANWQADFAAYGIWEAALPADMDAYYDNRATLRAEFTTQKNRIDTWYYHLSNMPTDGVHHKLIFNDPSHVRLHENDNSAKEIHGIFSGDAILMTELAWKNKGGVVATSTATDDTYRIPFPNAGTQGGRPTKPGFGQVLNYLTIITESGNRKVITAYPSL
ncbi:hypothetical protein [Tumebacillus permanentifrigoris]|uniref:Uncharacterized protein n=1 Tax=Tumebacillus permanentifrigoris TaxID=378543 RepID=A0A316D5S4_9BACL|nr:hypothetical protein [Tumebacillus permanentifrigoris]PWK07425.1 hypothetical protein C7459_11723 [Tumebacillus permanentifrigoris]